MRWLRLVLGGLLLVGAAGCSKEALKKHGIEVEEGKIKKRLLTF
jgi:hypothetical protein